MKLKATILTLAFATLSVPVALAQSSAFSDKDKSFLKDSTEDSLAEIKMAQLALKTTKSPEIRSFANKMITDHTGLINGAKPVASDAGVKPPTSPGAASEASYLKLKVLSGETFDKSYVKTMVSDHHGDLDTIKKEHDSTSNAEMKNLTAHAADVVAEHTKMIDALAGKLGLQ